VHIAAIDRFCFFAFFKSDTQRKSNRQMPTKSCRKLIDIILKPPGIIKTAYPSRSQKKLREPELRRRGGNPARCISGSPERGSQRAEGGGGLQNSQNENKKICDFTPYGVKSLIFVCSLFLLKKSNCACFVRACEAPPTACTI
jgi:hypothetical protein